MATANKQIKDVTLTVGDDPTHTARIKEAFIRDMQRRFERVRGLIRRTVGYQNDAFALKQDASRQQNQPVQTSFQGQPEPKEEFPTSETLAIAAFSAWVANAVDFHILEPQNPVAIQQGRHWTAEYLDAAAIQGVNQATGQLFQAGLGVENIPNDEILDRPNLNVLEGTNGRYYAAFNELDGISDDMGRELGFILREGLQEGWNPRKMADEMTNEVRDIEHTRAVTLARTETQHAHTQSALRNYQRAGVGVVGHVGRLTAMDTRVCPFCRRLSDEAFTIQEFNNVVTRWRGQTYRVGIPSHPNGRCAPVPRPDVSREELAPLSQRVPGQIVNS